MLRLRLHLRLRRLRHELVTVDTTEMLSITMMVPSLEQNQKVRNPTKVALVELLRSGSLALN
jgi:hypothetical protein